MKEKVKSWAPERNNCHAAREDQDESRQGCVGRLWHGGAKTAAEQIDQHVSTILLVMEPIFGRSVFGRSLCVLNISHTWELCLGFVIGTSVCETSLYPLFSTFLEFIIEGYHQKFTEKLVLISMNGSENMNFHFEGGYERKVVSQQRRDPDILELLIGPKKKFQCSFSGTTFFFKIFFGHSLTMILQLGERIYL